MHDAATATAIEPSELSSRQRWAIYILLVTISLGLIAARIATITRDGKTPMLSANDRSRWCTIRALVDHGTYAIDDVIFDAKGKRISHWQTIDLVQHRNVDGEPHYYSSKPPLLPTMLAGVYWTVKQVTRTEMGERPMFVIRLLLAIINLPCYALMAFWLCGLVERYGRSDWGRVFVVASIAFGTYLTSFSVTLNNHLFAAFAVSGCLVCMLRIGRDAAASWWYYFAAGLAAAFAVANELPALSMLCLVLAFASWRNWRRSLAAWAGAAVVIIAFFAVNYRAHHSFRPPYAHRGIGELVTQLDSDQFANPEAPGVSELQSAMPDYPWGLLAPRIEPSDSGGFAVWDRNGPFLALQRTKNGWAVHRWDDWYDYPIDKTGTRRRSYWKGEKQGVDKGEPRRDVYAFHVLIGHHGIFSLTPLWMLAAIGLVAFAVRADELRWFALSVILLSVVCVTFYLLRPEIDRNYGGVSSGFRWMFWFIPFYLLALVPVADWASRRRWTRGLCIILLFASVFSVHYGINNPWTQPWIFDYWSWLGWIDYS